MRVIRILDPPLRELVCLSASPRGAPETLRVPVLQVIADGLPSELAGLLLASDLQGVAPVEAADGAVRPTGEALVELLVGLEAEGAIPPLDGIGVLLAGDLYSDPSARKRGATGDVRDVWRAFAAAFRWVAGVGGNHDLFGASARDRERFGREPGVHLLDGEIAALDGLRVGGVSGIVGSREKPNRRDAEEMLLLVRQVVEQAPHAVVLHQGPDCGRGQPGNADLTAALHDCGDALVVCGHEHWADPLATLPGGAQVVNVTEKVLLLTPGR